MDLSIFFCWIPHTGVKLTPKAQCRILIHEFCFNKYVQFPLKSRIEQMCWKPTGKLYKKQQGINMTEESKVRVKIRNKHITFLMLLTGFLILHWILPVKKCFSQMHSELWKPSLIRYVALADIIAKAIQYQCHYLKTLCSSMIFSVQIRGLLSLCFPLMSSWNFSMSDRLSPS